MISCSAAARAVPEVIRAALKHEFGRFLFSGCVNTGVAYSVYLLLLNVMPYRLAYTLCYVAGVMVSYLLQTRWVFRKQASLKSFLAYPLVYVAQWLLGVVLLGIFVERLAIPKSLAPLAVIAATVPMTFVLSRFIIRRGPDRAAADGPTDR